MIGVSACLVMVSVVHQSSRCFACHTRLIIFVCIVETKSMTIHKLTWQAELDKLLFKFHSFPTHANISVRPCENAAHSDIQISNRFCTLIIWFDCLFVSWNKIQKTILHLLCWEESNPPRSSDTRTEAQATCVRDSGTYHVCVNLWLTLYKLMG